MGKIVRELTFLDRLLVVDGMSGAGKGLLTRFVNCIDGVELPVWDTFYEHFSLLYECGLVDKSAALSVVRLKAEERLYDCMVGRYTNFRYRDVTSVFKNPKRWGNIRRIFRNDGDVVVDEIVAEKNVLALGTHHVLSTPSLLVDAFAEKLLILEMVRHPASLVAFWLHKDWCGRMGSDPRDFTLWCSDGGNGAIPWFAQGNEVAYLRYSKVERTVMSIFWLLEMKRSRLSKYDTSQLKRVYSISFEKFIQEPKVCFEDLARILGKQVDRAALKACMKRQGLPRMFGKSEVLSEKDKILSMSMSDSVRQVFLNICSKYEAEFYNTN